jgi:purine-nucleoside phosphorylase
MEVTWRQGLSLMRAIDSPVGIRWARSPSAHAFLAPAVTGILSGTSAGWIMTANAARLAATHLTPLLTERPAVALILGSGLGGLADLVENPVTVPYEEIPGFPPVTVTGHRGRLVAGRLGGKAVVVFQGRFHMYEGHDPAAVVRPVRTAMALGARTLIVTCAAGAVNPGLPPGTLMLISDHLNLTGRNPLVGSVRQGEHRFPDLTDAYDPELRTLARQVAKRVGIHLAEGVYAAVLGPSYETPAEVQMIRTLGGDAVGMSTVPEVVVARAGGVRVLGVALITNAAAGVGRGALDHQDVLDTAARGAQGFQQLIAGVLAAL